MEPKFETKLSFKAVGMMFSGKVKGNELYELWDRFSKVISEIPNRSNTDMCYGIVNPFSTKMEDGEMEYVAAVEVDNFNNVPEGMVSIEIPESHYAIFTHKGHIRNFMDTIKFVFGQWLPNSDYKIMNAPELEVYDERFNVDSVDSELEFCIPVEKK